MFDLHCSHCRRRVLVGTRAIESWHEDVHGIRVGVRCACGALNLVRTGRRDGSPPAAAPTPAPSRRLPAPVARGPRARAA